MLVHRDEHWLVRALALQPPGPRQAADGAREMKRMVKRRTEAGGMEMVDHRVERFGCRATESFEIFGSEFDSSSVRIHESFSEFFRGSETFFSDGRD